MKQLHEILTQASKICSANIAIGDINNRKITYKSLLHKTDTIRLQLESYGAGRGHRIGILSSKSIESVCLIFGTLCSEAAYVPLDSEAPIKRNIFILDDCAINILLLEKNLWANYKINLEDIYQPIELHGVEGMLLLYRKKHLTPKTQQPDDLAIILYTSGSTGTPKGVMITHANALSFILWANEEFDFSEHDVFASIAPFHFDLSVFDLYVAILNGAQVQLMDAPTTRNPRMLSTLIEQQKITVWYSTPTLLKLMLNFGKLERFDHQSLRYILFAGEVFPIQTLKQIKQAWPQPDFYNLYGPTETNVVTYFKIPDVIEGEEQPYPIGKSCSFAETKILNPSDSTLDNIEGELWVSGRSISPGYWQDESKTKTVFEVDSTGKRWYKTGDLVSIDRNGDYLFKGRRDRMVKRNGYRIELAEIEAALQQHSELLTAAVITKKTLESSEIYAYYQHRNVNEEVDLIELKEHCLKYVPKYMLPDKFIAIQVIPQTTTHKVDYQRLLDL